jgi:purine-binding chemotaxis protein CheW
MAHGVARRRVADREKNLVGFVLDDVRYAVEIRRVREIVRPLPLVPLPHAPPAIIGVADHRGEVVPVLDVRRRLGLASVPPGKRTKWILVSLAARAVALVVDGVSDVFAASEQDRREVPSTGVGDAARGISAVFGHRGSLVFVLDVDRVAAAAELVDLPSHPSERAPMLPRATPGGGLPRSPTGTAGLGMGPVPFVPSSLGSSGPASPLVPPPLVPPSGVPGSGRGPR